MPKNTYTGIEKDQDRAGFERSEPVGRAKILSADLGLDTPDLLAGLVRPMPCRRLHVAKPVIALRLEGLVVDPEEQGIPSPADLETRYRSADARHSISVASTGARRMSPPLSRPCGEELVK